MSSAASAAGTSAPAAGVGAGTADGVTGKDVVIAPASRKVILTASVALRVDVKSTGKGADKDNDAQVAAVATAAGNVRALTGSQGYLQASSGGGTAVTVVLRVAPGDYDGVFTQLANLGTITSRQEKADDVTGQLVDLTSRMKTMQASVDRIRVLLAQAAKIPDIIAIESELTQREADLESLESQQKAMSDQVALSTITVQISSRLTGVPVPPPPAPPAAAKTGFVAGLDGGWHALKGFVKVVLQIAGAVLPFLPLVAVFGLAVLWLRRRQHRSTTAPTPPTPSTE